MLSSPPRKRGSTSVRKKLDSRFRGNDRRGLILRSGQRRLSFFRESAAFPSNARSFICQQPYMTNRQNEILACLPAYTPSVIAHAQLLRIRARFLSRDCGIGMIRQPTDSQRLDESRRQSLEVIAGGADPVCASVFLW